MNRTLKVIFCIFFFAVCLFFSLATFIPGASKITEGGIERPSLVKDGFINDDFGTDYEEYFSRAFAYRGYVVDLWSQTRAAIGEGNDQVVVGKDNFLFFAETIDSYTGNPMSDDEIKRCVEGREIPLRPRSGQEHDLSGKDAGEIHKKREYRPRPSLRGALGARA